MGWLIASHETFKFFSKPTDQNQDISDIPKLLEKLLTDLKHQLKQIKSLNRDQARGRLGRNGRPRGRNFALNGTQGEVRVSLKKKKKKKKIFFFFFFFF